MNTIQGHWGDFRENVLPGDVPQEVVDMMRHAFYCGAIAPLEIQTTVGTSSASPAAKAAILVGVRDECLRFIDEAQRDDA